MALSSRHLVAALALAAVAAGSGCGGSDAPTHVNGVESTLHPADFGSPVGGRSKWLPLRPGTQWVRKGATDVGTRRVPHIVTTTVTDVYKRVAGVRTVAVLDHEVDGGQVSQESLDYLAADRRGNVWYLGGYTENFEGGRFINAADAWLAGVNGARAGILVQANPRTGTGYYSVSRHPGEPPDVAEVVATHQRHCVPFKCYSNVLVVREGKANAPDNEFKYYAAGVGQIDNVPQSASQHRDVEKLVNLTHLTPKGLAEWSNEALKLDKHARVRAASIFGSSSAGRQVP